MKVLEFFLGYCIVLTGREVGTLCRSIAFDMLVTIYKAVLYNILEDLNLDIFFFFVNKLHASCREKE